MSTRFSLRFKIMVLVILILNLVLLLVGTIIIDHMRDLEINQLKKNAMDIAQSVARIPSIANSIGLERNISDIQSIAEKIRKNTQADFVVVMGMDGIRYSHPKKDRLGEHFVGGDELRVLNKGESYISQAVGTLGPSIRAFVPIKRGDRQVGAVAVGILLKDIEKRIGAISKSIYIALLFGDILGIIGSILLANNVKKSIFGLEPIEIAKLLQEKNAIIDSIKEGIIAIDKDEQITLANREAKSILNYDAELHGSKITKVITSTKLPRLLVTGEPEFNQEQIINDTIILTNRVPIIIEDEVVGAVASFNKKTEVQRLAKELTGVKKFVDALRSQNHEFMNHLHTISGLIQLGEYDSALSVISKVTHAKQEFTTFVMKRIKLNEIAGLLLGKFDRANELNIDFKIAPNSNLSQASSSNVKERLITIIGNLLENAMDSLDCNNIKNKKVRLGIFEEEESLQVVVRDSGIGIPVELQTKIFNRGFSTKEGDSQGIGLDLVKRNVDILGGDIELNSEQGVGSEFIITIPY
ncbi:ATP-binding protein [Selenihalanaerobacter shriftii]|uniref:histidine kinase n=1 Tax=Selenihalanaerobacter shriftii TaxID=142842 RepID=A0A1T4K1A7_9FIRM|nr:ATP-binding protein [Selenihalanaerobacter shriftii]SJZ36211.1 two-component system, CitB family, sensor histidine kinase DctS [Selenihalanaerobacter shriftii]